MHLFMLSMQLSGIMISKKVIFFNCLCLSSLYRTLRWRWSWSLWRESWQRNRSYSFLHREYPSLYKTRGAKMSWKPSGEHVYGRWLYIPPVMVFQESVGESGWSRTRRAPSFERTGSKRDGCSPGGIQQEDSWPRTGESKNRFSQVNFAVTVQIICNMPHVIYF